MLPSLRGGRRRLGPVVDDQLTRATPLLPQAFQDAHHPGARQGGVGLDGQALPREIIHQIEEANPTAIGQAVGHEIHRPALIHRGGRLQRLARETGLAFATAAAHL